MPFGGQPLCEPQPSGYKQKVEYGEKDPRCQSRHRGKNPRFTGVFEADDGTRTHDLLHGKQTL